MSGVDNGENGPSAVYDCLWNFSNPVGIVLAVISGGVMLFTFPMRITHTILIKSLIPIFGVPFAVAFMAAQLALLALMKSYRGLALAGGLFAVGMLLGWIGMSQPLGYSDIDAAGFSAARHIIAAGACISGLGIGITLARGALPKA